MAVDFDTLVLGPSMDVFSEPITITPIVSQPGQPTYQARGVFSSRPVDIATEDGGVVSDMQTTLGIRLSEFVVPPSAGDQTTVKGTLYTVEDPDEDGQGGSKLTLRKVIA